MATVVVAETGIKESPFGNSFPGQLPYGAKLASLSVPVNAKKLQNDLNEIPKKIIMRDYAFPLENFVNGSK